MIIINDCVQDLTFNVNDQCLLPEQLQTLPQLNSNLNTELLYQMIKQNEECCSTIMKYLITIIELLNKHQYNHIEYSHCEIINEPIKQAPIKTYLPVPTFLPNSSPQPIRPIEYNFTPSSTHQYKLVKYTIDYNIKGGFSIVGIASTWVVKNGRIVNQSGDDLIKYLPLIFNHKLREMNIVLERITCYRIIKDKPLLTYQTLDLKTGVRKLFEASPNLWDRYAK